MFLFAVIGIYLIVTSYPCLRLSLTGFPEILKVNLDKGISKIVFLYGGGICGTCPQGTFIFSLKDRQDVLFVVPKKFSSNEKENLRMAFMLKGKIINGDSETADYIARVAACSNKKTKINYYAELDQNKKIKAGKVF
ncbi:MAG: hypothetical protein GTO45_11685 [Candidatus Aminicenantes bacterium]|nr:hypothetical protein [Candidatus Aminicenantes bacterium]NIN42674.1 hypothetical protein [Candidatus Aminicenantes bacterium]NIN85408.1 hypothetical protein [Candidatus Aminicenantes bacterium]NIO81640.1 hypothetical protein [Candidatus Aminicenantes bacterium]NIQ67531.1 hypothetical protein [Candidatus Aminicenantes bacterium]